MSGGTIRVDEFREALQTNEERYEVRLSAEALRRLCAYYAQLLVWNSRLHLVAPCSPSEFATRHVLESLLLLPYLRAKARVADIGSGAGLPIIPTLISRPDIQATLIEASNKKVVFLREALRTTATATQSLTVNARFENLPTPVVEFVTCRALDRFSQMIPALMRWSPAECALLLFGGEGLRKQIEDTGRTCSVVSIPQSEQRYLLVCPNRVR